jgi:REP element-mobilizing transposase RayT
VTSRGNRRGLIYHDNTDRRIWLEVLASVCERHHCVIHSFCQMNNHYHLMIETVEPNLSYAMRQLNGHYGQYFNKRHGLVGHVLQGRYKAILVQKESYLLELSRYIALNPVRARLVQSPNDWRWSSHYLIDKNNPPTWLECDWLLSHFGNVRQQAVVAYRAFVLAGIGRASPLTATRHQVLLGDETFIARHQFLQQSEKLVETSRAQRGAVTWSLDEYQTRYEDRNEAMARAYRSTAFTMPQIAAAFGVSVKTVSRAVAAFERCQNQTTPPR